MRDDPGPPYGGETYYGQPQLKPSPFGRLVALYIWLAGLSGSAQLLAAIGDWYGGRAAQGMVRRGRYLAMLGAALGPVLLIADLHTPQRFYNMLRIFKPTSPMSIGVGILSTFSLTALATGAAQFFANPARSSRRWLLRVARIGQAPSAVAGAGMSVYTGALQSATSTPHWAAAPRALAVRYGASSMASAAAALSLAERLRGDPDVARRLDSLALTALVVELGAALEQGSALRRKGVPELSETGLEKLAPIALYALGLLAGRRMRAASAAASLLALAGGFALRQRIMAAGNESARRPDVSLGFAQPRNLPAK